MTKTAIDPDTREFIRSAAEWPTIREIAETWNVSVRYVRSVVERRRVNAVRLDFVRIDPRSWDEYMETVYRPAETQ